MPVRCEMLYVDSITKPSVLDTSLQRRKLRFGEDSQNHTGSERYTQIQTPTSEPVEAQFRNDTFN